VLGADLADLAADFIVVAVAEFALYGHRQRARAVAAAGDGLAADQPAGGFPHQDLVRCAEDADLHVEVADGMVVTV
jgi:hypothetical protein